MHKLKLTITVSIVAQQILYFVSLHITLHNLFVQLFPNGQVVHGLS